VQVFCESAIKNVKKTAQLTESPTGSISSGARKNENASIDALFIGGIEI
jgi:hypothetical protein